MNVEPSKRVGDYEIIGVLGRGGMGNVFKVRNVLSDRTEAMKILLPDLANGQELADRFRREIKVLASLDHPNIAAFRTALTWDNCLVMIMEYVEGMTLATRVAKGPLPLAEAVDYTQQVLAALAYAHARHIIHRDVKPANIMVTAQQVIKLMDFGIARCASDATMTMTGTTLGSLYYMSPEQVKGEPVDERSDLYSLGITVYELLTGKRPFEESSDYSIMAAQINKQPKPPILLRTDLPAGLSDIIMKAVTKEPAQRFQSANEFSQALTGLALTRQLATIPREILSPPSLTPTLFAAATKSIPVIATGPSEDASPRAQGAVQSPAPYPEPEPTPDQNAVASAVRTRTPYRGLYMSLGALIVLIVLIAAGLYLPRRNVAHSAPPAQVSNIPAKDLNPAITAGVSNVGASPATAQPGDNSANPHPRESGSSSSSSAPPTSNAQEAALPKQQPNQPAPPAAGSASASSNGHRINSLPPLIQSHTETTERLGTTAVSKATPDASATVGASPNTTLMNAQASTTTAADPEWSSQHAALEDDFDRLSGRAESINGSLNALRDAQQVQGLGLRGDVAASQARMQRYLNHAQSALNSQNASDLKKYLGLAQTEIENLEKFLGR